MSEVIRGGDVVDGRIVGGTVHLECFRCDMKAQAAEQAKRGAAKRKAIRDSFDLDVLALARQLAKLPVFKDCPRPVGRCRVQVVFTASSSGGNAGGNRIRIRISGRTSIAHVMEVTLHELVHLALPRGEAHGFRFRATLARAAREAWQIEEPVNPGMGDTIGGDDAVGTKLRKLLAYELDDRIETKLECLVGRGFVTYPKLVRTRVSRAERTAALVETRARHAATMLARAERRLKLAKTVHRRWHEKVSRYERIAAKKGAP
jgi:hypothetical protein